MSAFTRRVRAANAPTIGSIKLCRVDRYQGAASAFEFTVEGMLLRNSMAGLIGPPGSMKTLLAVDLCASVATGTAWFGRPVEQGPTFLMLGESNDRVVHRFKALEKSRQLALDKQPTFLSDRLDNFMDTKVVRALSDRVHRKCEKLGAAPALICVDPLSKVLGPGDENNASDMNRVLGNMATHFRDRFSCTLLIVHHTGHGNSSRARGSSAFRANLDTEMMVTRADWRVSLRCTKQKDLKEFEPMTLISGSVSIDVEDANGLTLTQQSVSLLSAEGLHPASKQLAALQCLTKLARKRGKTAVRTTEWRDALLKAKILPSPKSFEKMKAKLRLKGKILVEGTNVAPANGA